MSRNVVAKGEFEGTQHADRVFDLPWAARLILLLADLAALIARSWLVGLTILAVGLAGSREDGLMAAVLLLAAFTLYFVTSLLLRPSEREDPRP